MGNLYSKLNEKQTEKRNRIAEMRKRTYVNDCAPADPKDISSSYRDGFNSFQIVGKYFTFQLNCVIANTFGIAFLRRRSGDKCVCGVKVLDFTENPRKRNNGENIEINLSLGISYVYYTFQKPNSNTRSSCRSCVVWKKCSHNICTHVSKCVV